MYTRLERMLCIWRAMMIASYICHASIENLVYTPPIFVTVPRRWYIPRYSARCSHMPSAALLSTAVLGNIRERSLERSSASNRKFGKFVESSERPPTTRLSRCWLSCFPSPCSGKDHAMYHRWGVAPPTTVLYP